jgi:hypothetical protein
MFRMELVKRSQVELWCSSCAEASCIVRVIKGFYTKCGGIVLCRVGVVNCIEWVGIEKTKWREVASWLRVV